MEIQISADQKEMVKGYRQEALLEMSNKEQAASSLKDIITAASETTKIPKKLLRQYFAACYKDKVKEVTETGKVFEFLNE